MDNSTKKLVALSFDDGPDSVLTAKVLDKLEKYGVTASFFLIGHLITDETKPILDRMAKLGVEFNNHAWTWDSLDKKTPEEIKKSVADTSKAIQKYTGKAPSFFRAPNLDVSETLYKSVDLPFICGVVAYDWEACKTNAEQRAKNVLDGVKDGAIVLLHDVQPEPHPTPEALDIIIPELLKQNYEFVTVGELFRRKGVTPKLHECKMWTYV